VLQSVVFINRASRIIHHLVLFFHKRLNQEEYEGLCGLKFWRISLIELRSCGLVSISAVIFSQP